ncbi:hypothetical protein A9Q99_21995 [Gammaproteobacteria bacterium 45_16_T64]|nr:hypothetical protein A9Q99_21995 [Gammaproteobacteria bacterium 45_16_T64]
MVPLLSETQIDQKWSDLAENDDLKWDLGAISNRQEAIAFLMTFENKLCVYSSYVSKLYSTYNIVVPSNSDSGCITVLPDPHAFHDTFSNVPQSAVEATGVYLYPGEAIGETGLYIKIPTKGFGSSKELPFSEGFSQLIKDYRSAGDCFLPVLQNGDLREYENSMPSLHLHRIRLDYLKDEMSDLTLNSIKNIVADNLIALYQSNLR